MKEGPNNDLFDIRVNEVSRKFIRKLYPLGLASFILNAIVAIIVISTSIFSLIDQNNPPATSIKEIFTYYGYSIYSIVYSALGIVANYYYFIFLRKLKRSVINSNEDTYNSSFRLAFINTMLFMIGSVIGFVFIMLMTFMN